MNGLFLIEEWNIFAICEGFNNDHIMLRSILAEIFPSQFEGVILKRQSFFY